MNSKKYQKFVGAFFNMTAPWRQPLTEKVRDFGHSTKDGTSVKEIKARRKKNKNKKTHRRK